MIEFIVGLFSKPYKYGSTFPLAHHNFAKFVCPCHWNGCKYRSSQVELERKAVADTKTGGHCVVYTMLKSLFVFLITRTECLRCSVSNSRKDAEMKRDALYNTGRQP